MKTFLSLILSIAILTCSAQNKTVKAGSDTLLASLKSKKKDIEDYRKAHKKDIIVLAKVTGKKNLVRIVNMKWPDHIEYSYNILKNKAGQIIFIMQSPFSESGDWDIDYEHYFDEQGNTLAYYRIESIFGDDDNGVVRETLLKYYDSSFKSIAQVKGLTDKDYHPIKRKKLVYEFRDFKYTIYKNVNECLAAYHIQL